MNRLADKAVIRLHKEVTELRAQLADMQHKADAYDAMCEVGLIQFDPNIPDHIYSVWGFTCWHHDKDILKAIAAANESVKWPVVESGSDT